MLQAQGLIGEGGRMPARACIRGLVSAAGTEVWFSLCCRHKGLVRKAFGRMPARAHVMKVMLQAEVDGGQRVREDEAASQVERQQPPQQDPEKGLRYDTYILS